MWFFTTTNFQNTCIRYAIRCYQTNYRRTRILNNLSQFCARQLDQQVLIITLFKSVKQLRHFVYRRFKLWNAIPKDLSNRPCRTFINYVSSCPFKYNFCLFLIYMWSISLLLLSGSCSL